MQWEIIRIGECLKRSPLQRPEGGVQFLCNAQLEGHCQHLIIPPIYLTQMWECPPPLQELPLYAKSLKILDSIDKLCLTEKNCLLETKERYSS